MAKVDLRPMSTAPKDGTEILAWLVVNQRWTTTWWSESSKSWRLSSIDISEGCLLGWIPLPEPPTEVECG